MTNDSTSPLPDWQRDLLAVLLDALDGVTISDAERHSLTWLAGWERHTMENIAEVIRRARAAGEPRAAASAEPAREDSVGAGRRLCLHADDDGVAPHWVVRGEQCGATGTAGQCPADRCLWCGTNPAPRVVLGDPLCASCYRDHRSEVAAGG